MKQTTFLIWMIFTLVLAGCQEKTSTKRSSSNNYNCQMYPTSPGCMGTTTGTTAGGTTGGTIPGCTGNANYLTPGCPGYCIYNPYYPGCAGTTSGSTGGGTPNCTSPIAKTCANYCTTYPGALGCLPNGTNCWVNTNKAGCPGTAEYNNITGTPNYPAGEPAASCAPATSSTGGTLETRKATVYSSVAYNFYNPIEPVTANYSYTTPLLTTVAQAKVFFMTDSILKMRITPKPQPDLWGRNSEDFCYGRVRPGTKVAGYTKLRYNVKVYSVDANNSAVYQATVGTFTTAVNSCSPAIDLSYWKERSPTGILVVIDGVEANVNRASCQPSASNGWAGCNSFSTIRSFDCWGLDIEVAADGTKTF